MINPFPLKLVIWRPKGGLGNQLFQFSHIFSLKSPLSDYTLIVDKSMSSNKKTNMPLLVNELFELKGLPFGRIITLEPKSLSSILLDSLHIIWSLFQRSSLTSYFNKIFYRISKLTGVYLVFDYYIFEHSFSFYKRFASTVRPQLKAHNYLVEPRNTANLLVHIRGGDFLKCGFTSLDDDTLFYEKNITNFLLNYPCIKSIHVLSDDQLYANKVLKNFNFELISTHSALHDFFTFSNYKHRLFKGSSFAIWANFFAIKNDHDVFVTNQPLLIK